MSLQPKSSLKAVNTLKPGAAVGCSRGTNMRLDVTMVGYAFAQADSDNDGRISLEVAKSTFLGDGPMDEFLH